MNQADAINPWVSMWTQPRSTVRAIVHTNLRYGLIYISTVYALQYLLYLANFYSWGLNRSFSSILLGSIALAPILGTIWMYFNGGILFLVGKLFRGKASFTQVRAALVWSRIPFSLSLFMWMILLTANTDYALIQYPAGSAIIFITFVAAVLVFWSFILLVQGLREVQCFSILKSICNTLLSGISFYLLSFSLLSLINHLFVN